MGAKTVDILNIQTYPGIPGGAASQAGRAKKLPGWGACASDDFLVLWPCQRNYTVLMQVLICPLVSVLNARFTKIFKNVYFVCIDTN